MTRVLLPFRLGDAVRYKPASGHYSYDDALEADGRLPGLVIGFTRTRVQIELTLTKRGGQQLVRRVAATSLTAEAG